MKTIRGYETRESASGATLPSGGRSFVLLDTIPVILQEVLNSGNSGTNIQLQNDVV